MWILGTRRPKAPMHEVSELICCPRPRMSSASRVEGGFRVFGGLLGVGVEILQFFTSLQGSGDVTPVLRGFT